jgi:hypothetical protein
MDNQDDVRLEHIRREIQDSRIPFLGGFLIRPKESPTKKD